MAGPVKIRPVNAPVVAAPQGRPSREEAEDAIRTLLRYMGENPEREGLIDTPGRVVSAICQFYHKNDKDPTGTRPVRSLRQYDSLFQALA